jgi:hypothetical protein
MDTLSQQVELAPTNLLEELPQTMIPANLIITEISNTQPLLMVDKDIQSLIKDKIPDKLPPKIELIDGIPYYNERIYVPPTSDT